MAKTQTADGSVPTTLPFTDQDAVESAARKVLAEGIYRFVVTKATRDVVKKPRWAGDSIGTWVLTSVCSALRDPEDGNSALMFPSIFYSLDLPYKNPEYSDHTAPDSFRKVSRFLQACFDLPAAPEANDEGIVEYKGKGLASKDAVKKATDEHAKIIGAKVKEVWADLEEMKSCAFFGEVVVKKEYNRIINVWGTLPEGKELSSVKVISASSGDSVEDNGSNGGVGAAKPAKSTNRRSTMKA